MSKRRMITMARHWRFSGGSAPLRAAVVLLVLLLGACCTMKKETAQPQLPVHFVHQDGFDITWREELDGEETLFYGKLLNDHSVYLENLCMTVSLLDERGAIVDSRTFTGFPVIFPRGALLPFSLRFPYRSSRVGERVQMEFTYALANASGPGSSVYQTICHLDENKWEAGQSRQ